MTQFSSTSSGRTMEIGMPRASDVIGGTPEATRTGVGNDVGLGSHKEGAAVLDAIASASLSTQRLLAQV